MYTDGYIDGNNIDGNSDGNIDVYTDGKMDGYRDGSIGGIIANNGNMDGCGNVLICSNIIVVRSITNNISINILA